MRGISAGGFCPSPSIVQMTGARAAMTPEWTAADCPAERGWRTIRSQGLPRAFAASPVPSSEPSSTKMAS